MIGQKIRIYPTNEQKIILDQMFDFAKEAYNTMLNKWQEEYQAFKNGKIDKKPSEYQIRDWYKQNKDEKYQNMTNMIVETEAEHLAFAYKRFFKTKKGYPQIKKYKNSFSLNAKSSNTCSVKENVVKISKILRIKMSESYKYKNPKVFTISKHFNEYFISISFDDIACFEISKTGKYCGIDTGLETNIVLYDNQNQVKKYDQNKNKIKRFESSIKKYDKQLSRKIKNSNSYLKTLKKKQNKIINRQNRNNDFYNKVVLDIVKEYDIIGIEDLNINGLKRNRKQSKSWNNATVGRFNEKLINKANMCGKEIVKINRFFPSSQLCSCCLNKQKMPLYKRVYKCSCGMNMDRDENAAKNIMLESQRILKSQSNIMKG